MKSPNAVVSEAELHYFYSSFVIHNNKMGLTRKKADGGVGRGSESPGPIIVDIESNICAPAFLLNLLRKSYKILCKPSFFISFSPNSFDYFNNTKHSCKILLLVYLITCVKKFIWNGHRD